MALNSPSVSALVPGLYRALQHLQYSAGVSLLRQAGACTQAANILVARSFTNDSNTTRHLKPSPWQRAVRSCLFLNPTRPQSTLTPMTMDPAFAPATSPGKDLVAAISAFAAQGCGSSPAAAAAAPLPVLAEQVVEFAPQLAAEDIASVAAAFARMGFAHTGLSSALAMQVTLRMPMCPPSAVAQTAWAFGELQYYNYEFLEQLAAYMKQNYAKFSAPDLARVLWALGKLGYQHEVMVDMWHELALKTTSQLDEKAMNDILAAEALAGSGSIIDDQLQSVIADYASAHVGTMDAEDLGKLAYGLARFSYEDPPLYDAMAHRAVEIWDHMRPVDVRRMLTAFADSGHFNKQLLDCMAGQWLVAHEDDPDLEMPDLRLIVRAFNVLGYSHPNIGSVLTSRMGSH